MNVIADSEIVIPNLTAELWSNGDKSISCVKTAQLDLDTKAMIYLATTKLARRYQQ